MTSTEFDQLTPAQKRVVIAEDVVKHIRARDAYKIQPYCVLSFDERYDDSLDDTTKISVENIASVAPACCVCAKGAMMLSRIMCFGGFTYQYRIDDDEQAIESLEGIFDPFQLDLIEAAFEKYIFSWHVDRHAYEDSGELSDEAKQVFDRAVHFGERYAGDSDRLLAIMQNIISNQGIFLP